MKNISIQRLSCEDWELYRDTRLRALAESPDAFGSTLARESTFTEEVWRQRLERTDCITLIATSQEAIGCGLVVGGPYDSQAGVYSMWVDPDFRGYGLANRLIKEVITWARHRGDERILLDVGNENHSAIKLYQSNGFESTGVTGTLPPPREHIKEHQRSKRLR